MRAQRALQEELEACLEIWADRVQAFEPEDRCAILIGMVRALARCVFTDHQRVIGALWLPARHAAARGDSRLAMRLTGLPATIRLSPESLGPRRERRGAALGEVGARMLIERLGRGQVRQRAAAAFVIRWILAMLSTRLPLPAIDRLIPPEPRHPAPMTPVLWRDVQRYAHTARPCADAVWTLPEPVRWAIVINALAALATRCTADAPTLLERLAGRVRAMPALHGRMFAGLAGPMTDPGGRLDTDDALAARAARSLAAAIEAETRRGWRRVAAAAGADPDALDPRYAAHALGIAARALLRAQAARGLEAAALLLRARRE